MRLVLAHKRAIPQDFVAPRESGAFIPNVNRRLA